MTTLDSDFHKYLICIELPQLQWTNLLPNLAAISYDISIIKASDDIFMSQTQAQSVQHKMLSNESPYFHWDVYMCHAEYKCYASL